MFNRINKLNVNQDKMTQKRPMHIFLKGSNVVEKHSFENSQIYNDKVNDLH